jgi:hypothetical protein
MAAELREPRRDGQFALIHERAAGEITVRLIYRNGKYSLVQVSVLDGRGLGAAALPTPDDTAA